ncbi:MAG TPA: hypothetical protein VLA34_00890 [Candidatus Krumholzibacterium sp.]|nr:hypothetical protein [Candidatus Krumholzibacterium sp.]
MRPMNILLAAGLMVLSSCGGGDGTRRGEWMGMKPPGLVPEVFAPGVVSTGENELNATFTPDGNEFYFARRMADKKYSIFVSKRKEDGSWTVPEVASFSGTYSEADPFVSPDGRKLFYISRRPRDGYGPPHDIFILERRGDGWSEPIDPGPPLNTPTNEIYPTVASDGTLYYVAELYGGEGRRDVYRMEYVDGKYEGPELVGPPVSSNFDEGDPYIAPDESYIIFVSVGRPGGFGSGDLYVSFADGHGGWTEPANLGESVNSEGYDYTPVVTHDGRYLFFTRSNDVYWVDAKIIEDLRP